MVQVTITVKGMVQALSAVRVLGEAGRAVNGPLGTWGSRLIYAPIVENRWRKGSGGAHMFRRGIDDTAKEVPAILEPAMLKGAAAVGQAKRKIRDRGIENIRKYTPVKTGALRDSVREATRPEPV